MMNLKAPIILFFVLTLTGLPSPVHAGSGMPSFPLSIYGEDNRQDLNIIEKNSKYQVIADSTVALFSAGKLDPVSYETSQLFGHTWQSLSKNPRYTLVTQPFKTRKMAVPFTQPDSSPPRPFIRPDGSIDPDLAGDLMTRILGAFLSMRVMVSKSFPVCSDERFYGQPTGAYCSGTLIGSNLVLTAGHCITDELVCENTRFVFGFDNSKGGDFPKEVEENEVYRCEKIVYREEDDKGADFAIIQLDRWVFNHKPLKLNDEQKTLHEGTPLFVVGHPVGLPTKVSDGAKIRDIGKNGYFTANLDTFGGNSGSAVFNAETNLIEGVLVRGETDFELDPVRQCVRARRYAENDKDRGEHVTRIANIVKQLDLLSKEGLLEM